MVWPMITAPAHLGSLEIVNLIQLRLKQGRKLPLVNVVPVMGDCAVLESKDFKKGKVPKDSYGP